MVGCGVVTCPLCLGLSFTYRVHSLACSSKVAALGSALHWACWGAVSKLRLDERTSELLRRASLRTWAHTTHRALHTGLRPYHRG